MAPSMLELRNKLENTASDSTKSAAVSPVKSAPVASQVKRPLPVPPPFTARSQSETTTSVSWRAHRSTQSVSVIPSAKLSSGAGTYSVKTDIILEPANPSKKLAIRPPQHGRSRSLFDIPSARNLKAPSDLSSPSPAARAPLPQPEPVTDGYVHEVKKLAQTPMCQPKVEQTAPRSAKALSFTPKKAEDHTDKGSPTVSTLPDKARCSGCNLRLFSLANTSSAPSRVITLPGSDEKFHERCFTCSKCRKSFHDGKFVELDKKQRYHDKVRRELLRLSQRGVKANLWGCSCQCAPAIRPAYSRTSVEGVGKRPTPSKKALAGPILTPSSSRTSLQQLQHRSAVQMTPFSPSKLQVKHPSKPLEPTRLSKASEIFASKSTSSQNKTFGGMYTCAGCGERGTLGETTRECDVAPAHTVHASS